MSKFSDLAAPLAEKFKMTQKDADQFLSAMTDVLNDGLRNDKLVKIKGLGTFKVASVSARKSVNVNTGEPIVIEGREKISFTPDASLKERVNSPFAQFETTVVNEGVDFSAIDKKIEKPEAQKTEVPTAPTASPTAPSLPPPEGGGVATALPVWSPPPSGGGREGASPSGGGREGASPSGGDGGRLSNPSSRRLIYGTVALLLLLVVFGAFYFLRDATQSSPKVATTKSATPTASPSPSKGRGEQSGCAVASPLLLEGLGEAVALGFVVVDGVMISMMACFICFRTKVGLAITSSLLKRITLYPACRRSSVRLLSFTICCSSRWYCPSISITIFWRRQTKSTI